MTGEKRWAETASAAGTIVNPGVATVVALTRHPPTVSAAAICRCSRTLSLVRILIPTPAFGIAQARPCSNLQLSGLRLTCICMQH